MTADPLTWEPVDTLDVSDRQFTPYVEIERLPVTGGYLYRSVQRAYDGTLMSVSLAFVPDVTLCAHGSAGICMDCITQTMKGIL